jgi:hypothetical protein
MSLYSYKGQEPTTLPLRIRLDDGSTRTSLNELSVEELKDFGFFGPISKPEYDEDTQKIEWDGSVYKIITLTDEEIVQRVADKESDTYTQKLKNIDYNLFWQKLVNSSIYKKLRGASLQSLTANTLCTELISIFGDAKAGKVNVEMIQRYINILFFNFKFTQEEIEQLKEFMDETNLIVQYTLPDEEYISTHVYDAETNTILPPKLFDSWILVNGDWEAPVSYPNDGKVYNWDEEIGAWVLV